VAIRGWTIARAASGVLHRQIKEKTVTKTTRAKAIEREVVKNDIHHVPTSVDAYTVAALKEWFEDKDISTVLKNCLTELGSNFTDYKKRHRRTLYEADQGFERFGKTLIANFKDTATLWEFLRASLRQ
jgi:hypothetical protein